MHRPSCFLVQQQKSCKSWALSSAWSLAFCQLVNTHEAIFACALHGLCSLIKKNLLKTFLRYLCKEICNSHRKIFPVAVAMCYSSQLRDQLLCYWCHCSDVCMAIIVIEVSQADGGWMWEGTGWCNSCAGMPTLSILLPCRQFVIRALPKHQEAHANLPHDIFKRAHPYSLLNVLWKCSTQNQAAFSRTLEY